MSGLATEREFRAAAAAVSNWGRWGEEDELGTLNLITAEHVRDAAGLVRRGAVFSLGTAHDLNGPQGGYPFRINPLHFVAVGGDYAVEAPYMRESEDPVARFVVANNEAQQARFNDDWVVMPLQAASQWDALSHVYYGEELYNGFHCRSVTHQGATKLGIEQAARRGVSGRGVLLDVARHRGVDWLEPEAAIEPEELDEVARTQGVAVGPGDILCIRTGWWDRFLEARERPAPANGGPTWRCARWLHEREVSALAADNVTLETLAPSVAGFEVPLHCLCLRDMGMMFGEFWNLGELATDCAADGVYEFQLTAPPIEFTGGLGSPLNPLAIK